MYGKRAWSNGQWVVVPDQNASAVQGRQGRWWSNWGAKPSSQAYWDTKLTDNGLQLTNMDIRYVAKFYMTGSHTMLTKFHRPHTQRPATT
jgi:hypothetical protein